MNRLKTWPPLYGKARFLLKILWFSNTAKRSFWIEPYREHPILKIGADTHRQIILQPDKSRHGHAGQRGFLFVSVGGRGHTGKGEMKFCPKCGRDLKPVEIDAQTRLGCSSETCDYVFWNNPTPVVAALVEREGLVVLVRNKEWPQKMYGLVSGFLERNETPESGVLREVKEELGLVGRIVDFIGIYSFFEMNQLILAFHVRIQGEMTLGQELAEIKMVPPEKLRPWAFGTGHAVKDWLKKRKAKMTED